MAFGQFGGNGSVEWQVHYKNLNAGGIDPIPFSQIGNKSGNLKVTVDYVSHAAALAAWNAAKPPAKRITLRVKAKANTPGQVRVVW